MTELLAGVLFMAMTVAGMVMQFHPLGPHGLTGLVDRLHNRLQEISRTVTASVGVAWEQLRLTNEYGVDGLLRHADRAMRAPDSDSAHTGIGGDVHALRIPRR
jgi:hypothetical protein